MDNRFFFFFFYHNGIAVVPHIRIYRDGRTPEKRQSLRIVILVGIWTLAMNFYWQKKWYFCVFDVYQIYISTFWAFSIIAILWFEVSFYWHIQRETQYGFFLTIRISVGLLDGLAQKITTEIFGNFHQQYSIFVRDFVFHRRTIRHTVCLTERAHESTNITACRGIGVECATTAVLQCMHKTGGVPPQTCVHYPIRIHILCVHRICGNTTAKKQTSTHRV